MSKRKSILTKELRLMMYGFGDVENPRQDTVDLVEDMVIDYITETISKSAHVSHTATRMGGTTGTGGLVKLRTEDLMFVLRDEPKKLARVEELLYMNEVLEKARKVDLFDGNEEAIPGIKSAASRL